MGEEESGQTELQDIKMGQNGLDVQSSRRRRKPKESASEHIQCLLAGEDFKPVPPDREMELLNQCFLIFASQADEHRANRLLH